MKMTSFALILFAAIRTMPGMAATAESMDGFLSALAGSDIGGLGTYVGGELGGARIDNITCWWGTADTNSVVLTIEDVDVTFIPELNGVSNGTVFFWGTRRGWNSMPSNTVFRTSDVSAWELREKLVQAGSAGLTPSPPNRFTGSWLNISTTNANAMVNLISNIVQSLCVSSDLNQYSEALIPPLEVGWESELFMFKADAHMEMLKLEWGESEDFLVHVLNSPQYPGRFRGSALFQLKKRFDWPATNTVPEP